MRKSTILKALPRRAELKKTLRADRRLVARVVARIDETEALLDATEGVRLHGGVPVVVTGAGDAFTVRSVGTNGRTATGVAEGTTHVVTTSTNADDADVVLSPFAGRAAALKAAMAFVATGKAPARAR